MRVTTRPVAINRHRAEGARSFRQVLKRPANLAAPNGVIVRMLRILILLATSVTLPSTAAVGQPAPVTGSTKVVELPRPSGPLHVGRVTVRWVDTTRLEPLSATHDYRELMVDIWYPTDPSVGKPEDYLDAAAFERALGASGFQRQFREASE